MQTYQQKPGTGGTLCLMKRANVPEKKENSWKVVRCPICGAECWETDGTRRILAENPGIKIACTNCALKNAGDEIKEDSK